MIARMIQLIGCVCLVGTLGCGRFEALGGHTQLSSQSEVHYQPASASNSVNAQAFQAEIAQGQIPHAFGAALENMDYSGVGPVERSLPDGAKEAHRLGLKTLKISMSREAKKQDSFYHLAYLEGISFQNLQPRLNSLTDMAKLRAFDFVLSIPFETIFIQTSEIGEHDPNSHSWNLNTVPLSPTALAGLYQEHYDLTRYLMTKFNGSGRTFVLQDHEADWHASIYDPVKGVYSENTDIGQANYLKYWSTRQKAITDARNSLNSNVHVYNMCEVVRLRDTVMSNAKSLARDVIPNVTCDLIGYSAHDTALLNDGGATLDAAIKYLKSRARTSPTFGNNQVILSEIAVPEMLSGTYLPRIPQVTQAMVKYMREGMPWVLYWAFYDRAYDANSAGDWLIKPNNDFSQTFRYFMGLLNLDPNKIASRISPLTAFSLPAVVPPPSANSQVSYTQVSYNQVPVSSSAVAVPGAAAPAQAVSPANCQQPKSNYERYFCATYSSIFSLNHVASSTITLFSNLYASHQLGCNATIRDLIKEDTLRAQAVSPANTAANSAYIDKLYRIHFGRNAQQGDSPQALKQMRAQGASLETIEKIFMDHPETAKRCAAFGLVMTW